MLVLLFQGRIVKWYGYLYTAGSHASSLVPHTHTYIHTMGTYVGWITLDAVPHTHRLPRSASCWIYEYMKKSEWA
jgi:hypothetical protein